MSRQGLSLRQRLLLIGLVPAALLAAAMTALFLLRGLHDMDAEMRERGLAIVSFLAPAAEYGVVSGNRTVLSTLLQAVLAQRDVAAAAIYDRHGELLAVSGRPSPGGAPRLLVATEPAVIGDAAERLSVAAPVQTVPLILDDVDLGPSALAGSPKAITIGRVLVELDKRPLIARKNGIILSTLLLVALGLGLMAALASSLARAISDPLGRLVDAVRRIAAGDLNVSVPSSAPSEDLRALEHGFNAMARSIADAHHTLQARVDAATAQLAHQAMHDPLTGLPNRRAFEQALDDMVSASRQAATHGALCFIDLDRFKIVNDTCGHAAGDELLRRITRLIMQRVRAEDMLCRVGGDEFALILRECSAIDAHRIASELRETVATFRFSWEGRRFTVGASIGLVQIDGSMNSASDILVAADLACYAAKKSGRNRVVEHHRADTHDRRRGDAGAALPHADPAPPGHGLKLHGQPILPLAPAAGGGWIEVLLRGEDAHGGMRSAHEVLTQAGHGDAAVELDLWVADTVCALIAARRAAGAAPGRYGLNLGRATVLAGERYVDAVSARLSALGLHPELVVLEFPATVAEQLPDEAGRLVARAHAAGLRVALERLEGSAAGLLRELRPDYVKISFKHLVETYGIEAGCTLAQALCAMASALSIETVASEVEDITFRDALPDYGFHYAQGYIVAPLAALEDMHEDSPCAEAPEAAADPR